MDSDDQDSQPNFHGPIKFGAGRLPIPPGPWFDQPQLKPAVKQGFSEQPITLKTQSVEGLLKAPHKLLWELVRWAEKVLKILEK